MHIPMAMSSIHNTSELEGLIPGLGNTGDSKLQAWGSEGVDQAEMTVGTWEEIEAAEAAGSNSSSSSTSASETVTSSSAVVSVSATSKLSKPLVNLYRQTAEAAYFRWRWDHCRGYGRQYV